MFASSSALPLLVIIVLIAFALTPFLRAGSQNRAAQRSFDRADEFIRRAEMQLQMGKLDDAESNFAQATRVAHDYSPLLASEGQYGLARVAERRGDHQKAVRHVEAALSYAPQWRDEKPNYERLLNGEKRRFLDLIGKQL